MRTPVWIAIAGLLALAPITARAQEGEPDAAEMAKLQDKGKSKKDGVKAYDQVITDKATTKKGVFLVHELEGKLYYEIPTDVLGAEFLWVTQIKATGAGSGLGGTPAGDRVVRWEMRDEDVLLRDVKFQLRAAAEGSIRTSVQASSLEPIIATFPVKAWGKDKAPVIEVTTLFKGDVDAFSPKRQLNASGVDKDRTFIEKWKAFPTNLETEVLATYRMSTDRPTLGGRGPGAGPARDSSLGVVTALIHHSMVKLPDQPMEPRALDSRIGYFSVGFEDYGTEDHQVKEVEYITRWRLEKKDPQAEVSEPKQPIVFYIGRGVPEKWRPYVKQGIEAWQPAFEKAGFKNAILAKDAPSEREDPDWDAEDARYSSIRWLPSTTENAMGPHVHDPRTGEILEADILVFHNILKLVRDWYFVQVGPLDERCQKLPLPDALIGELLAYVITHEVGHSLGFRHNMKASSSYTVDQLRDPQFTAEFGTEASVMDYGRYNYVAQPGDGARLIPILGPYDYFAVQWGYQPFAGDAAAVEKQLDELASRQVDDPKLRFGDPNPALDPSQQTEDLGSDPVAATTLGLLNIDRVAGMLVTACCEPGEDYTLLSNMYGELIGQRDRELGHVVNVVAGMVTHDLRFGQGDRVFEPVAAAKQREAVAFLMQHAFDTPQALIASDIVDRLSPTGTADRILASQSRLLRALISDERITRMAEHANRGGDVYPPIELLADVRSGIWRELRDGAVQIDLYRRNLQRACIDTLSGFIGKTDARSDLPALARGEMTAIQAMLRHAIGRTADEMTRRHLLDLDQRIDTLLEPRSAREGGESPLGATGVLRPGAPRPAGT